jgi:hypothetical protein
VQRFGNNQVQRYLENQKKATEDQFTETPRSDSGETQ